VRFLNKVLGVTPTRSPMDIAMARLAAAVFTANIFPGASVDIGTGYPEEVAAVLHQTGVMDHLVMINESGVFGGVSAPGAFFGSAVNPNEMVSSAEAFRRIYQRLDAVIVGALEVDSKGNVNVAKRGEGAINYVGPGGFIDLTCCADVCMFVCSWMAFSQVRVTPNGHILFKKRGPAKFVDKVDEITFNGQEALKLGKKVFYITHVGAFQLTSRGVELICVMPGIDIKKDILEVSTCKLIVPDGHAPVPVGGQTYRPYLPAVPQVDHSIVTGRDFKLILPGTNGTPPAQPYAWTASPKLKSNL